MKIMGHYSTTGNGIGGEIKRRVSDFIVEEITPAGEICRVAALKGDEKLRLEKEWPAEEEGKEQLLLTLEKFNMETALAITKLARFMQVSRNRIGYAGLKDKRAVSAQRISVWKPDIARLREFESRYIDIRDAKWGDERVEIGDLRGNRFEVAVRNIELPEEEVRKRVGECFAQMENGIANYFGEQRFGGARAMTHLVGREFIRGGIEDAVMLYLTATYPLEEQDVKEARTTLAGTRDFGRAIREFPKKYRYERSIIHHLCKYPHDYAGAFRKLPKSLCYLFTHAYQAWLFNRVIDRRIEAGMGSSAAEGNILEDGVPTAPLFGFESELASGAVGQIERSVLEEEGMELHNFKVASMPELSSKGSRRKAVMFPKSLTLISIESDEFNEGKLKASVDFELEKGCYATVALRELMKI